MIKSINIKFDIALELLIKRRFENMYCKKCVTGIDRCSPTMCYDIVLNNGKHYVMGTVTCKFAEKHTIKQIDIKERNKRLRNVLEELIAIAEIQDGADDTTSDLYVALKIAEQELEINKE